MPRKYFKYRIVVEWSTEDQVYIARVPVFEALAAHGNTPDEAAKEAVIAAEGMLAVLREQGKEVPATDISRP